MIKYISILLSTIKNDENKTLRYFRNISRYEQATTFAIAAGDTSDQRKRFRVLMHVVTPSQRHVIVITNL